MKGITRPYILFCCIVSLITSCDNGSSNRGTQNSGPSSLNLMPPLPATAPALPANMAVAPVRPIVPGSIAAPPAGRVVLNPAHGQPGHRCDIPEGSPLPGATTAPSVASVVNGAPAVVKSTAKPNPKHGEPGHRCDIPVGAPLDSPPGQTQSASATNSNKSTSGNSKLNPKHGEPGHRCDIAVGAPLDSPPSNTAATASKTNTEAPPAADSSGGVKNQ